MKVFIVILRQHFRRRELVTQQPSFLFNYGHWDGYADPYIVSSVVDGGLPQVLVISSYDLDGIYCALSRQVYELNMVIRGI